MEEPLGDPYVLARRELATGDGTGRPVGVVRFGRPLFYPVPAADLPVPLRHRAAAFPGRYVGALFAFDLDAPPPGRGGGAVRFRVSPADPRAVAVQLDRDGDGLGVSSGEPASAVAALAVAAAGERPGWLHRLASRAGLPRAAVTGTLGPRFGWVFDRPAGRPRRAYAMHALLEVPGDVERVAGAIDVEVRGAAGRPASRSRTAVPFAEPLTPADVPAGAAVRLCVAAGAVGDPPPDTAAHERAQALIVDILDRARRAAGIASDAVRPQPQGDGQFTVLPAGIDESVVIPRLARELDAAVRRVNGDVADGRLRLRVALHRGLMKEGWTGEAPAALHRLLDSRPVREALAGHPAAGHVLAVPDVLYRDVVVYAVEPPLPDDFTPITVDLPDDGLVEHGWLHLGPGGR